MKVWSVLACVFLAAASVASANVNIEYPPSIVPGEPFRLTAHIPAGANWCERKPGEGWAEITTQGAGENEQPFDNFWIWSIRTFRIGESEAHKIGRYHFEGIAECNDEPRSTLVTIPANVRADELGYAAGRRFVSLVVEFRYSLPRRPASVTAHYFTDRLTVDFSNVEAEPFEILSPARNDTLAPSTCPPVTVSDGWRIQRLTTSWPADIECQADEIPVPACAVDDAPCRLSVRVIGESVTRPGVTDDDYVSVRVSGSKPPVDKPEPELEPEPPPPPPPPDPDPEPGPEPEPVSALPWLTWIFDRIW